MSLRKFDSNRVRAEDAFIAPAGDTEPEPLSRQEPVRFRPVPVALLALVVLLSLFFTGRGYQLDRVQTAAFPVILLLLFLVPRRRSWNLPAPFFITAFLLWALGAGYSNGYFSLPLASTAIFLSADADQPGGFGREFHKRFNDISSVYGLPRMKLADTTFENRGQTRRWLSRQRGAAAAIRGSKEDAEVVFSPALIFPVTRPGAANLIVNETLVQAFPWGPLQLPIKLVTTPSAFSLRAGHEELVLHYLAWLLDGVRPRLGPGESFLDNAPRGLAFQATSLRQASTFAMGNQANAFRGIARFYLGVLGILEALRRDPADIGELKCAETNFLYALRAIGRRKLYADYRAAALNNLAIVKLLQEPDHAGVSEALRILRQAASIKGVRANAVGRKKKTAPSASVAWGNLAELKQAGMSVRGQAVRRVRAKKNRRQNVKPEDGDRIVSAPKSGTAID